ncbi:MAG: deoxyribose-phosphate aldolase [Bacteroidales bacterium]|nr:deoxyribose-phosphate aldolase [Bacteroidales bacterium]
MSNKENIYTKDQIAGMIDHAVLKPEYTNSDIYYHSQISVANRVYSMCVRPCDITFTKSLLKGSGVKVSSVLSFPHGADTIVMKESMAYQAINDGTDEIDMVMNIGKFLSGDYEYVVKDIMAVVDVAHKNGVLVKVIQESGFLTLDQVAKACKLSVKAGADFVKTSTGFGPGKATPEIIKVMVQSAAGKIRIKASGGIRNWDDAVTMVRLGADRIGTGSSPDILAGAGRI